MASSSSVNGKDDVLETQQLMNDGTIDAIRLKIINHLKAIEELKNNAITMVKQKKVCNISGSEKQTKRELYDALRQDQETPASKSVWELIMDNDGLGKEINEIVERVFSSKSGYEPPLLPPSNSKDQQDTVKEKEISGKEKETEHLDSSSKKRDFGEMHVQTEEGEATQGSGNSPSAMEEKILQKAFLALVVPHSTPVAADCVTSKGPEERKRCRRTDGKTWRCSRECVEDKKYCERHLYRGRKKSKNIVENTREDAKSNQMVDLNRDISSSKASQPVASDTTTQDH